MDTVRQHYAPVKYTSLTPSSHHCTSPCCCSQVALPTPFTAPPPGNALPALRIAHHRAGVLLAVSDLETISPAPPDATRVSHPCMRRGRLCCLLSHLNKAASPKRAFMPVLTYTTSGTTPLPFPLRLHRRWALLGCSLQHLWLHRLRRPKPVPCCHTQQQVGNRPLRALEAVEAFWW
jgi:hypothetical protein